MGAVCVWMSALIVVSGCIPRRCCPVCGAGLAYGVCLWRVGLPCLVFGPGVGLGFG